MNRCPGCFRASCRSARLDWYPSAEVPGPEVVLRYVAEGFGAGLAFGTPGRPLPRGVRAIPLKGFPQVSFWRAVAGQAVAARRLVCRRGVETRA